MALSPTLQTAIEGQIVGFRQLAFLDFDGDQLRATNGIYDITFSGTGDADLDGETFISINSGLISISDPVHNESGSDTVTASMSGLVVNDADFLALISDKSNWQGRLARLWWYAVDNDEQIIGNPVSKYVGYMSDLSIAGSRDSQSVSITIENYISVFSQKSNKTYAMQRDFDSTDESPDRFPAAANGGQGAGSYQYSPVDGSIIGGGTGRTIENGNTDYR